MTQVKLHGILKEEFGESAFFDIGHAKDVFDAIDANRRGFKKRVVGLGQQGFHYAVLIDGKNIKSVEEFINKKRPDKIDVIPVLSGSGDAGIGILIFVLSTAASILLAPEPPKPPEIQATTQSLEKSFTFSNLANRAAQGTPVPVGYGELLVGSEVIQSTIKSYPQNQRSFEAFRRNAFNPAENPTESSSQLL